jgi:hypothetical protein
MFRTDGADRIEVGPFAFPGAMLDSNTVESYLFTRQPKASWSFAAYCSHVKQMLKSECARGIPLPWAHAFGRE